MKKEKLKIGKQENKESGIFIFGDSKEKAIARIFPHENQDHYAEKIIRSYNNYETILNLLEEASGGIYPKLQQKIRQALKEASE